MSDPGLPSFVVVSGPPGSGKSTVARSLADAFGMPLIAKDTIKEALMGVLDVPDVATSRLVGRASVAAMLAVAVESRHGVLESVWHRTQAVEDLRRLPGRLVEVFCRVDPAVAQQRYLARATSRAAGHFDADRVVAELWNDEVTEPVAGGWPVIEVDTSAPVDVAVLVALLRDANQASAAALRTNRHTEAVTPRRRHAQPGR